MLDRVLRTEDGGHTWADVSPPEPSSEDRLLNPENSWVRGHFFDERAAIAIFSSSGNVWRTEDGGGSWQSSSAPIAVPDYFSFPTASTGWALADLGPTTGGAFAVELYRSHDGGATWETLISTFDNPVLDACSKTGLDFTDENVGWITRACPDWDFARWSQPSVDTTTDGGVTWSQIALPPPAGDLKLFTTSDQFEYHCGLSSPRLFSPRNGVLALSCRVEDLWAGQRRVANYLYRTYDGGATWATDEMPGPSLEVIDQQHLWSIRPDAPVSGGFYPALWRIYRSDDAGTSWIFVKATSWNGQFSFLDQRLIFAVAFSATRADETALVRSADGGISWEIIRPITRR